MTRARLAMLADTARAFAVAEVHDVLELVARQVGVALGAFVAIRLRTPDGGTHDTRVAGYHPDPQVVADFFEIARATRPLVGGSLGDRVIASRAPIAISGTIDEVVAQLAAPFRPLAVRLAFHAILGVPLLVGDRATGVVILLRETAFDDDDLLFARVLVDRAALAIDNSTRIGELEHKLAVEKLEAEAQRAHAASRLKTEFLANMSHELRTPLNAILGFANVLETGKGGMLAAPQLEYVGEIVAAAGHLLHLITDVLELANADANRLSIAYQTVEVRELFGELAAVTRPAATAKSIACAIEIDPAVARLSCDPRLVRQGLFHYLSNAVKFTAANGSIRLRAVRENDREVRLEVEDTGIGIARGDLPRLFVEFQQLDQGMAKAYQGTGLGLAIVKRVAEAHGGRVGVASQLGVGSRFWIVLPLDGPTYSTT